MPRSWQSQAEAASVCPRAGEMAFVYLCQRGLGQGLPCVPVALLTVSPDMVRTAGPLGVPPHAPRAHRGAILPSGVSRRIRIPSLLSETLCLGLSHLGLSHLGGPHPGPQRPALSHSNWRGGCR